MKLIVENKTHLGDRLLREWNPDMAKVIEHSYPVYAITEAYYSEKRGILDVEQRIESDLSEQEMYKPDRRELELCNSNDEAIRRATEMMEDWNESCQGLAPRTDTRSDEQVREDYDFEFPF